MRWALHGAAERDPRMIETVGRLLGGCFRKPGVIDRSFAASGSLVVCAHTIRLVTRRKLSAGFVMATFSWYGRIERMPICVCFR